MLKFVAGLVIGGLIILCISAIYFYIKDKIDDRKYKNKHGI